MGIAGAILDSEQVDKLVDPQVLIEDIKAALLEAYAPQRLAISRHGRWLGLMPAISRKYYVVKIVGVYPGNPARGLPLVRGVLLVIDAETGDTLLAADAAAATGWRTAAATALALRLLGVERGVRLGVIGAGVQADYHLRILKRVLEPREISISSRSPLRARRLAERHGAFFVDDRVRLLKRADVIVAATSSTSPVVEGKHVPGGVVVASVGAPRPVKEVDPALVIRAGCVLADTKQGVLDESDEIDGIVDVLELRDLLRGRRCSWREVRLYKSVGTALLDYAIGVHLLRRLGL